MLLTMPANNGDSLMASSTAVEYSAVEVNLKRLLRKCEVMAVDLDHDNWRFPKYVEALEDLLSNFELFTEALKNKDPAASRLADYKFRVSSLKKHAHPDHTSEADQRRLLFERRTEPDSPEAPLVELTDTVNSSGQISEPLESVPLDEVRPPEGSTESDGVKRKSATTVASAELSVNEMREELLHASNKNLDNVLAAEQAQQEKITSEMLYLVKTMKENSRITSQLVKKDFKVIDKAVALADRNVNRLSAETAKLAEQNKKNTSWWILFALFVLFGVFVAMVLFMRIFPKPRR